MYGPGDEKVEESEDVLTLGLRLEIYTGESGFE